MNRLSALPLIIMCTSAASAATLPLKSGTYVLANVPCHDPAFAAMFTYDGRQFSYPHAKACQSETLSRLGRRYRVRETCSAEGDGSAAAPSTTAAIYEIFSARRVSIDKQNGGKPLVYRWCTAP